MNKRNITIRSISSEGVYYLVNGWNKYKTFFVEFEDLKPEMLFTTEGYAERSLNRLIKVMPEYKDDIFDTVKVMSDGTLVTLNTITYDKIG